MISSYTDLSTVSKEASTFHDHALTSSKIEEYRNRGETFLNNIVTLSITNINSAYQTEVKKIEKKHEEHLKSELKKQKKKLIDNSKSYQKVNTSKLEKLGQWLLSGIPSICSATLIAAIGWFILISFASDETRQAVILEAIYSFMPDNVKKNELGNTSASTN